jgi:hypothetical protein
VLPLSERALASAVPSFQNIFELDEGLLLVQGEPDKNAQRRFR